MKKKLLPAFVILGIGSFIIAGCTPKSPATQMSEDTQQVKSVTNSGVEDQLLKKDSRYAVFSPTILNESAKTRRILFFYAKWCPTCISANENFTSNASKIPDDVTLIRVNYNDDDTDPTEKELAKKYGVTYQHTFVQIDSDGNRVAIWNGGEIEELLTQLK